MTPKKVMLLRGLTRGNGHWANFPELLQQRYPHLQIELMEIPGNGTLNQQKTPIDPFEVIGRIKMLSQFARLKQPFQILGISLGGMIALKWAEQYPGELTAVTVVNTSLRQLSPFYQRLQPRNYLKLLRASFTTDEEEKEWQVLECTANDDEQKKKYLQKFVSFSKEYPIDRKSFVRQLILANRISIGREIKVPIQIINSAQDRLVDPRCSWALAQFLGQQKEQLWQHPTAGHDLPLDAPEWLAEKIQIN